MSKIVKTIDIIDTGNRINCILKIICFTVNTFVKKLFQVKSFKFTISTSTNRTVDSKCKYIPSYCDYTKRLRNIAIMIKLPKYFNTFTIKFVNTVKIP